MDGQRTASPRARIAWLSPEPAAFAAARQQFQRAGYLLFDAAQNPAGPPPDVAVVDLRHHRLSAKAAQKLSAVTRETAPDCGLVYVAPMVLSSSERAHLRRSGDLVIAGDDLTLAIAACRQKIRLRNIAEEAGERLKSIAAASRLSEFPPIETAQTPPKVIVAGAAGPVALAALTAVERVASLTVGALTAAQAMRAIEAGAFDCAVVIPKNEGDPLLGLARSMRRHRRFQDLPVILVAADALFPPRLRISGAYISDVLSDRHVAEDVGARVLAASRRARLASTLRRFLSACAGDGVRDRMSGAFAPQFLSEHGERLFARAEQSGRALSVTGVRLAVAGDSDDETWTGGALADAAKLVQRVTRAEDFVARLSSDTLIVMHPATEVRDAESAARRIEGVIANTMFRKRIDATPFAVVARAASLARQPHARLDETIAGVLARLKEQSARSAER